MGLPPLITNVLLAIVSVGIMYAAAFRFRLSWPSIVGVMVITAVITDVIMKMFASKKAQDQKQAAQLLAGAFESLFFSLIASVAILVLLSIRFGFPMALGVVIIGAIATGIVRFIV